MKLARISRLAGIAVVLALLLSLLSAMPAQAVPFIGLSPTSGKVGDWITVSGTGFPNSVTVYIYLGTTTIGTPTTSISGTLATAFVVPASFPTGATQVTASSAAIFGSGTWYASADFAVIAIISTQISLSPTSGLVGVPFSVTGQGFGANQTVSILFDSGAAGTVVANAAGTFTSAPITVPPSAKGSHTITAQDALANSATATFTTNHSASVTPASGVGGTSIQVSGSGFKASSTVTITLGGVVVVTDPAAVSTNTFGSFSATFSATGAGGTTVVGITDGTNTASGSFTLSPTLTVDPVSGQVGDSVTLSGTGFAASTPISVSFGGQAVATGATDLSGSFVITFSVPGKASGTHQVTAGGGASAMAVVFEIGFSASISATDGNIADQVTVTGAGYGAGLEVKVDFGGERVATVTADATGGFSVSFAVPARGAGAYEVRVSDGTNSWTATFQIQSSSSIDTETTAESPGNVGDELTVSGIGFVPGQTVTVTYDGREVVTASVQSDGTYTATFKVPASAGGEHNVVAAVGDATKQFSFVMESEAPRPVKPLLPEMGIKAAAEAHFDWSNVTDASGLTYTLQVATSADFSEESIKLEKTGLIESEYTVTLEEKLESTKKDFPYYWRVRATDGASNESRWSGTGTFYVGSSFSLSQPVIYALFGVGALIFGVIGFLLGRRSAFGFY